MRLKKTTVLSTHGRFFHGQVPGTLCFIPDTCVTDGRLDDAEYVLKGWATLNIQAQPEGLGVGSHLFPDLAAPSDDHERCNLIKGRMERLRGKGGSTGAPSHGKPRVK